VIHMTQPPTAGDRTHISPIRFGQQIFIGTSYPSGRSGPVVVLTKIEALMLAKTLITMVNDALDETEDPT